MLIKFNMCYIYTQEDILYNGKLNYASVVYNVVCVCVCVCVCVSAGASMRV